MYGLITATLAEQRTQDLREQASHRRLLAAARRASWTEASGHLHRLSPADVEPVAKRTAA